MLDMPDNVAAAKAALAHLEMDENAAAIRAKSRDFFWYSPVLKEKMDHLEADFVVSPRSEAEVIEILRVCYAHDVPVTTRGAGTGNYGQAMPLRGGCVMHLRHLDKVREIGPGRVVVEPGAIIRDIDAQTRAHSGQELRMMPSTYATATIGGFVAGGSGGIGSVRWGALRDFGNIIRLRVVTMEAEPRVLELTGDELPRVSHAFGTNGIITELEMPLAPAYDWVELIVTFDDLMEATQFTSDVAAQDGLLLKLATTIEAPIAHDYFQRLKGRVGPGTHLVILLVAPHSLEGLFTFMGAYPGAAVLYRSDDCDWERGPGALAEYTWNHTTLRALKVDPSVTYLQVRCAPPDHVEMVRRLKERFGDEVLMHLEVMRETGQVMFAILPIVKYTTRARLEEIIAQHEEMGAMVFNPHRYTLEEGGRQSADERQLAFKKEADPKGLLNPGKMIAWDAPDWDYSRMYDDPGMRQPG